MYSKESYVSPPQGNVTARFRIIRITRKKHYNIMLDGPWVCTWTCCMGLRSISKLWWHCPFKIVYIIFLFPFCLSGPPGRASSEPISFKFRFMRRGEGEGEGEGGGGKGRELGLKSKFRYCIMIQNKRNWARISRRCTKLAPLKNGLHKMQNHVLQQDFRKFYSGRSENTFRFIPRVRGGKGGGGGTFLTATRLILKPNSWTFNFVEVYGHNLESFQTWGVRVQCLQHKPV
jgi:hypothetical protein